MSDDLAARSGLPTAYRYLLEELPRLRWHEPQVGETARFWLQMHGHFRHQTQAMTRVTSGWRSGTLSLPDLHRQLIPTLQGFLQHLDGHHNIETHRYFPMMRQLEPRIGAGIDLMDRDHDAIHAILEDLFHSGLAFHQAVMGHAATAPDAAARMAESLDRATPLLARHLDDEEDIVVPLITRHADRFQV
ncbi:hemerythrin domain-containing protein [Brevundimonas sp.]|uniref:hemerythrin domain-containing protein n=1 Tax=Brevundimonas sp. TaxID=1871086 RepID=UPI001DBB5F22|nr:hemerythrin domain-containing protein [Brevundimonas sp.]MBL0948606.1 hemerythrin domain-containing protein [Brevundimonas sp.]